MLTLILIIGLIVGFFHFLRSLRYQPAIETLKMADEKEGLLSHLHNRMREHLGSIEFRPSEISQFINMCFKLLTLPIILVKELFRYLIKKAKEVLACAKMENLASKEVSTPKSIAQTVFTPKTDPSVTEGIFYREMLLALFCLLALIIFTYANYQILKIGLPIIWSVEKLIRVNIFGKIIFIPPISALAIVMILAEFLLGLFGFEFLNKRARIVKNSKLYASLCYAGLIIFALAEATMAVLRTVEMRKAYYAGSLDGKFAGVSMANYPFWIVGIISFIIPLITAFAFDRTLRYLNFLWPELVIVLSNIISFPIVVVEAVLNGLKYFILFLLDIFAAPFRMFYDLLIKKKGEANDKPGEKLKCVSTALVPTDNNTEKAPLELSVSGITHEGGGE